MKEELTKEIFEAGIRDDRTVEGHDIETYYCQLEYATEGKGFLSFIGDNGATNVEIRVPFTMFEQNGWQRTSSDTHTFTTAELDLLIKTACEIQKEHCVNVFSARYPVMHGPEARTIDRALCPNTAAVLAKFEEVKKDG